MKLRPILFSTPMVRAILAKLKWITRRTKHLEWVNEDPDDWELDGMQIMGRFVFHQKSTRDEYHVRCPYGEIGDVLWVRETWFYGGECDPMDGETIRNPRYFYRASDDWKEMEWQHPTKDEPQSEPRWKPSIHMPKAACRLFLKIQNIRVERLHAITDQDALDEGIEWKIKFPEEEPDMKFYRDYSFPERFAAGIMFQPRHSFKTLWVMINGKDSWDKNPWVWVITFAPIDKPRS